MSEAPDTAPVARLAASQLRRMRRIVDAAVVLADEGGFDGVRLRDVAEASGVALGTLYKYFRSKEDILLYALTEALTGLEVAVGGQPLEGDRPVDRLVDLFDRATQVLTRRPNSARALLRSIASGDEATAVKVAGFHMRMSRMIISAIGGVPVDLERPIAERVGTEREQRVAMVLNQVWFASLVGWSGGLHDAKTVADRMREAAELILPD